MKQAEQVTFGGGALDRAAHLRTDDAALSRARSHPDSRAIVLWRGKPLVRGDGRDRLALMPLVHPALATAGSGNPDQAIFLGLDEDGAARFACDISDWAPDDCDETALGQFFDASEQWHPAMPEDHVFADLRRVMARLSPGDAALAATARAIIGWHVAHRFCAACGNPSGIGEGGWQRVCPECGARHFPRTDPVVIMLITNGNSVLLGRSPGWPEGMFSLLAGFIEPGETMEAAVRREVMEEAGIPVGEVSYLASQPWPFPASLMFGCAGEALAREIHIDPVEIEEAMWISREDMMQVFAGAHPAIKPARRGAIAHFLLQNWLADRLD